MGYNKGVHSSSSGGSQRARLYALMLILAFGGALLGTMMLHKLRERQVYNLLVKDKDKELFSLQLLLQKEKYCGKEIERKNDEMKAEIYALEGQKTELHRKVLKMKSTLNSLKEEQKVMESALEEKQNEIRMLQGRGNNLGKVGLEGVKALRQNLMQKEAEIKELKQHLAVSIDDPIIFPENLSANGTEDSHEANIYENVTITNEDLNKTELNKFKDGKVTDEIQDGKRNNGRLIETHGQIQENWQVEGTSGGGIASKEITDEDSQGDSGAKVTAKYLNGKENKSIREDQPRQVENNVWKHSHDAIRTTGKHWRMNGMKLQAKKQKLDEIGKSAKQEGNFVQQKWSGRHINKADNNAGHAKGDMFNEDNYDSFKESKSVFEDENMEYRDEIYESEFQGGLQLYCNLVDVGLVCLETSKKSLS